jgi:hypothetical protein
VTYSPADLVACQHYLHAQTGQPWDALGIIHGTPQGGGYHEGNDLLAEAGRLDSDYSKRESSRDRPGTDAGSAFDLGDGFPRFREITLGLVRACEHGDPRTRDIREVIYTPDGSTVRRWDRLGIRSSGDDSHLTHTHISFHRDSEGRRDRADNLLGLLQELFEGVDMNLSDPVPGTATAAHPGDRLVSDVLGDAARLRAVLYGEAPPKAGTPLAVLLDLPAQVARVALDAKAAASLPTVVTMTAEDRAAIVADLAALLKPLIPTAAENAAATLDEQHRRDEA